MSNDTEITPALTASEWEDCETAWPVAALSTTTGGDLTVSSDDPENESFVRVPPHYRHAVAALALYKQTYGFTQEDVELLLGAANKLEADMDRWNLLETERPSALRAVAAKLAALLPPG